MLDDWPIIPLREKAMTSIVTRAAFIIISTWHRHRQKRMERQALLTIICRKNNHLRRDAGLIGPDNLAVDAIEGIADSVDVMDMEEAGRALPKCFYIGR